MGLNATRTIRFEKAVDEALQTIAKHEKMTVNAIVNSAVRRYVEWDIHAERFGMVEASPAIMIALMKNTPMDEARALGRTMTKDIVLPAIDLLFGEFNFENTIEFLRRYATYARRFNFEDRIEGRKHVILIRHSMGIKWSAYYAGVMDGVLVDTLGIKAEAIVGPETCVAKFELPVAP
ncbi:MAG: hypothetical protein OK441_02880 [Thaumarchaeota archaeon]|nr:hypothetical protein [Nitrososphaerota archaeon]